MLSKAVAVLFLGFTSFSMIHSSAEARDNHDRDHDHDHDRDRDRDRDNKVRVGIGVGNNQHWVDGHYEVRSATVMVEPERFVTQEIPAVYETRVSPHGRTYQIQVSPAQSRVVTLPARYETRETRVWIEGHYVEGSRGFLGLNLGF